MKRVLSFSVAAMLNTFCMAAISQAATPEASTPSGRWSTLDIVEAPVIVETAISTDGNFALYIVRQDHVDSNSRDSSLFEVDLRTFNIRQILRTRWLTNVRVIPGTADWSMLADIGYGVQLYRMGRDDKITPLVMGKSLVTIGSDPANAISESAYDIDQAFGVLGYGWSPDGSTYWYSTARQIPTERSKVAVLEAPTMAYSNFRPNVSELHVVDDKGVDRLVASTRGGTYPLPDIMFSANAATWRKPDAHTPMGTLTYQAPEMAADGHGYMVSWTYNMATGASTAIEATAPAPGQRPTFVGDTITGPNGGQLNIVGSWGNRHLIETASKQRKIDFGRIDFALNTYWSPGAWVFPGDQSAVVAVRHKELNIRSNLVKLGRQGPMSELEPHVSLTNCALSETAERGICIRQGINVPPTLVMVDVRKWTQTPIAKIDSRYDAIEPLKVDPRVWKTGDLQASGFVVYPREYDPQMRYPAIVVTHGSDADNSFVYWGFQWSYPVQVWSERGYVVIYINDISIDLNPERLTVNSQLVSRTGNVPITRVQDIGWLDDVSIYKAAIQSLEKEKIIDPARVGIVGYSRGSAMVNVAVSQTDLFKAASSGDPDFHSPSTYWISNNDTLYKMVFGGPPYDSKAFPNWQRLSPTVRANQVKAAMLFQAADDYYSVGKFEFYRMLKDANVPAEFVLFSQETHFLHHPQNRMTAMEQNLDWFDFWLKGVEDPKLAKAPQYKRWRAMREKQKLEKIDALDVGSTN